MEALVSLNLNEFFSADVAIARVHDHNDSRTRRCSPGSPGQTYLEGLYFWATESLHRNSMSDFCERTVDALCNMSNKEPLQCTSRTETLIRTSFR